MSEDKSLTDKYQALNRLTLRGIWLMLEAYAGDPPEIVLIENVPLIVSRGRHLLDQIGALLRRYGYVVNETTHDCGELGGLAQSRKRFLLVARHAEKVPPFLYEPPCRPLRAVGDVLGRMAMPGDLRAGPMHRIPALQWKTWVRLAFVEAGGDWRSLNKLAVDDGALRDFLIVPESRAGFCGVRRWDEATGTVTGRSRPTNGAFSVADPRGPAGAAQYQQYGVRPWSQRSGAIIGVKSPGQGVYSVADPRNISTTKHNNCFRVVPFDRSSGCVTSGGHPIAGGQSVAHPRIATEPHKNVYRVVPFTSVGGTVTAGFKVTSGGGVADPRPTSGFQGAGKYRVTDYRENAGTVIARSDTGQGAFSVADPRVLTPCEAAEDLTREELPGEREKLICFIRSMDNTWHRPFTTLELAALQSLIDPEEKFELDGLSDQAWRERIGNAVPPAASRAIAEEIGRTLLMTWTGQTFALSNTPIWVRDVALAITMPENSNTSGTDGYPSPPAFDL